MQVFKAACKIILRHPVYLGVYIILLSLLGVFLVNVSAGESLKEYEAERPTIAIIDRDESELSAGLSDFLADHAEIVEIEDNKQALQDTTAQEVASYILIIPQNYGTDFRDSAVSRNTPPQLETIVSYTSIMGTFMDELTNEYLSITQKYISFNPDEPMSSILQDTSRSMANNAEVDLVNFGDSTPLSSQYVFFIKFSAYPMLAGIIVCVGMMMAAFNKSEVRKRNLASPISNISFNFQTAGGCLVVALIAWGWINLVSFMVFADMLAQVSFQSILLILLATFIFTTVPLSLGFLFANLGFKENATNAFGNILGLSLCFLGGLWIDPRLLGDDVMQIAHFTPSFWYGEAVTKISELSGPPTQDALFSIFSCLGIVLLFAAAIFAVALVVGRLRMQSAEAGGNAAAQSKA